MNGRNNRKPEITKKIATPTSMRSSTARSQSGTCARTHGAVANVACTSSTIVMPKKRNASKHGKCKVFPDSKPAAPISAGAASGVVTSASRLVLGVVARLLLVVLLFDIHRPHVVVRTEDVLDRQHRGIHRVILVVVTVHAVTADGIHVGRVLGDPTRKL